MRARFQSRELLAALKLASKVALKRHHREVLTMVRLDVTANGATITATDLDTGIVVAVSAVVEEPGSVVIAPGRVSETLKSTKGEIAIAGDPGNVRVELKSSVVSIPAGDLEDFPPVPAALDQSHFRMDSYLLKDALKRVAFATDAQSTRYALAGVLIELSESESRLVATDSRRLATSGLDVERVNSPADVTELLPNKTVKLLGQILGDMHEPVAFAFQKPNEKASTEVTFMCRDFALWSRMMEGRFPRYRDIMPRKGANVCQVRAEELLESTRQAMIPTDDESRGVDYLFSEGSLTLESCGANGKGRLTIPVEYRGEPMTLSFDPKFVIEFLASIDRRATVEIFLNGENSPVLFEGGFSRYVVMPLARDEDDLPAKSPVASTPVADEAVSDEQIEPAPLDHPVEQGPEVDDAAVEALHQFVGDENEFIALLRRTGRAVFAGVEYRLDVHEDASGRKSPAFIRGNGEPIVGFRGTVFGSVEDVLLYIRQDVRARHSESNSPISEKLDVETRISVAADSRTASAVGAVFESAAQSLSVVDVDAAEALLRQLLADVTA